MIGFYNDVTPIAAASRLRAIVAAIPRQWTQAVKLSTIGLRFGG